METIASDIGLEDINQTTVYIPYQEEADRQDDQDSYSLFPERDLPSGYELRLTEYNAAWSKCLTRIQELTCALHAPVIDKVATLVDSSYIDTLPGIPYTELPVISVSMNGASSLILHEIAHRLEGQGRDPLFDDEHTGHLVAHIFPSDCSNIASAVKTLITSFITRFEEELGSVERRPAGSLTTMSMDLLRAWFDALLSTRTIRNTTRLVAILHDFEQCEPSLIQDFFEICSLAIPHLPLVIIISLSSPLSPSYMHSTYPRQTLALLQVRHCSPSPSNDIFHDILAKTFFDVHFQPELMIGPTAIDFLVDFFGRHSLSLDGLTSVLQLVHMKHFEEPLTAFLRNERLGSSSTGEAVLAHPTSFGFLNSLFTRIHNSRDVDHATEWRNTSIKGLLASVQAAREAFRKRVKLLRVALQSLLLIRQFMISEGYKVDETLSELMCGAVRGRLQNTTKYLGTMVKKLRTEQLDGLLSQLDGFFHSVPPDVQEEEGEIISRISAALSASIDQAKTIAEPLADWLWKYFQERLVSLEDSPLWDVWYTGSTPFPADLLNPSLRASILTGLLHPQDFYALATAGHRSRDSEGDGDDDSLLHMPDTSILFQRYLESCKLINVYDWFESFAVVLEAQKRQKKALPNGNMNPTTPDASHRTPSRRGRANKKMQREELGTGEGDGEDNTPQEEEEELESWQLEVQARFIRALHELDYVGLIKHTGRKPSHVLRTVFDAPASD